MAQDGNCCSTYVVDIGSGSAHHHRAALCSKGEVLASAWSGAAVNVSLDKPVGGGVLWSAGPGQGYRVTNDLRWSGHFPQELLHSEYLLAVEDLVGPGELGLGGGNDNAVLLSVSGVGDR